jgi:hypothetical protein
MLSSSMHHRLCCPLRGHLYQNPYQELLYVRSFLPEEKYHHFVRYFVGSGEFYKKCELVIASVSGSRESVDLLCCVSYNVVINGSIALARAEKNRKFDNIFAFSYTFLVFVSRSDRGIRRILKYILLGIFVQSVLFVWSD